MQPFEREGSYCVCNGEIYGFERLRRILEGKGYEFRSGSALLVPAGTVGLLLFPRSQGYGVLPRKAPVAKAAGGVRGNTLQRA